MDVNFAGQQLLTDWTYDRALFDAAQIQPLMSHFLQLLTQLADSAGQADLATLPPAQLPMMDSAAQNALLARLDGGRLSYPENTCIHELIEHQARQNPEAVAVVCEQHRLSYRELNVQANRLARYLVSEHGIKPDTLVGVCLDRSVDIVVAILAVLKAGGAYVPLDPNYPVQRLQYMLSDAKPAVVLTNDDMAQALSCEAPSVVVANLNLSGIGEDDLDKAALGLNAEHLAYVIYTSGSTGNPKGVMISHQNLVHSTVSRNRVYPDLQGFMLVSSFSFDSSIAGLFSALTMGARLCVSSKSEQQNLDRFVTRLIEEQISHFLVVPSFYEAMLEFVDGRQSQLALKGVIVAGEACATALVERHQRCLGSYGVKLFNEYGPTEATVWASVAELDASGPVTIGKAINNTQLVLLTADGALAPEGSIAELYIGGDGLARGYLNRPVLTDEKFIVNPFDGQGASQSRRLYRTGDLVKLGADGNLVFVGRTDAQVKIRGFRVELGEIAEHMDKLPEVASSLVVVDEHSTAGKRLVAYVVPQQTGEATLRQRIIEHLQHNLPQHMVPATVMSIDDWPRNNNGKIDKQALPKPDDSVLGEYVAPVNAVEQQLQALWGELLGHEAQSIGTHTNFFELGGDSILSIQLVSRAARQGLHFGAKDLFENQTIARLADKVQVAAAVVAEQGPVEGLQPLLPIQRAFFDNRAKPQHFNQAMVLSVPQNLQTTELKALVAELYRRHDALSVIYQSTESGWQGHYQPQRDNQALAAQSVSFADLSGLGLDDYQQHVDALHHSFALDSGALFKAELMVLPDAMATDGGALHLLLVAHHLVVDGVSWRILLEDLTQLYGQQQQDEALKLADKTSSYRDWGEQLERYSREDHVLQQRDYWLSQFDGFDDGVVCLAQRGDQTDAVEVPGQLQVLSFTVGAVDTAALLGDCHQAYRTTINELLLAAVALGVNRAGGQGDLLLDLESHGRHEIDDRLDTSQTVGWFTSVYPLRLSCIDDDMATLINNVKTRYRSVPDHGLGFGLLQQLTGDEAFAALPARELIFNYLGQLDTAGQHSDFAMTDTYSGRPVSLEQAPWHGLTLTALVSEGQLSVSLDYQAGRYDAKPMAKLLDNIQGALLDIISHTKGCGNGAYAPVDFPMARLKQSQLSQWQQQYQTIEDLYPATGMQQGLLFHSLMDSGSYINQLALTFEQLDVARFKQAWVQVIARHSALRTVFVGLESGDPHQLVLAQGVLDWREQDLSNLDEAARQQSIDELRQQIREQSYEPAVAPLMSLLLIKLDGQRHTLIWSHHHAILDGWCLPIIFADLTECYRALGAAEAAKLAPVSPYRDYAAWLHDKDQNQAKAYWCNELAEIDSRTPLPWFNHEQDKPQDKHSHCQMIRFDQNRTRVLQDFARRARTTINILLQGAWSLLLGKYAASQRVMFGATTSGRPPELAGVDTMVGLFINTLPVVVQVPGEQGLDHWLQDLHARQQNRERYNYVPLSDIQQWSGLNQGLFDSLIVFENYPVDSLLNDKAEQAALNLKQVEGFEGTNYAITIKAHLADELHIDCEFNMALSETQGQQLARHLANLLWAMAEADDAARVSDLVMLDAGEQQRQLQLLTGPQVASLPDVCIHQVFAEHARRNPDAAAVICGAHALSYGELDRAANQLAHYLIDTGKVGADVVVGLCAYRSVELVVGMLAILKAGAAYLPLDPDYPKDRLTFMLEDADAPLVLGQSEALANLALASESSVELDKLNVDGYPDTAPQVAGAGCNIAYVIYTSGSTGQPKGVMVEHHNLVNYAGAIAKLCPDVVGGYVNTNICFDGTATSFWVPLLMGKYLKLSALSDVAALEELVSEVFESSQAQLFKITPAHLDALIYATPSQDALPGHRIFVGGEAFSVKKFRQLPAPLHHKNVQFFNHYGPSEATVGCTVNPINSQEPGEGITIPIGKPLDNTQLMVLDRAGQMCPQGVIGELHIGGGGIARGYWRRSELTEQRFIAPPAGVSAPELATRWYKTGDLVRCLDDGKLEFVGRSDEQVKVRGFRIELGEVQHRLIQCEGIESALVLVKPNQETGNELVAYIELDNQARQARQSGDDVVTQLVDTVSRQLPHYMLPGEFALIEQWPLTNNGKIDKKALAQIAAVKSTNSQLAPSSETELVLAGVWSELLQIDVADIKADVNFFQLGGHSLLLLRKASLIEQALGFKPTLEQLYSHATIVALGAFLDKQLARNRLQADLAQREDIEEFSI